MTLATNLKNKLNKLNTRYMENFLPKDYKMKESTGGNYMRFKDGANRFRILTPAIVGFEYFTVENKPVRSKTEFPVKPQDIKQGDKVKEFWAFVVWNYAEAKVQILQLPQVSIMREINALATNPDWPALNQYDLTVTKTGQELETRYTVQPTPPKALPEEAQAAHAATSINLEALFTNSDPFAANTATTPTESAPQQEDTINVEDIAF